MALASELEILAGAWPAISDAVRMPRSFQEYERIVRLLDTLTDMVGEDETHPLASLMDVLGVLVERYEDENVSELAE